MTRGEVRWLSADEQRAWRAFLSAYGHLHARLDAELVAAASVTLGEYEVLSHLADAPEGELRMNELAERCGLSPSGLTRRFDGMARNGWVERRRCTEDRRGVLAALTEAGREQLAATTPAHVASVRRHFIDHVTPDELAVLAEVFTRLATPTKRKGASDGAVPVSADGTTPVSADGSTASPNHSDGAAATEAGAPAEAGAGSDDPDSRSVA